MVVSTWRRRESEGCQNPTSMEGQHQRVWFFVPVSLGHIEEECTLGWEDVGDIASLRRGVETNINSI